MKSLEEIKAHFKADQAANESSLSEYKEAKQYFHAKQLPQDVSELISARGQVPITENIYKMIINKILGYKSQSVQELKVSGRQEQDKDLATLLNDILKVFSQSANFDREIIKRDKELIFGMAVTRLWINEDEEGDFHISLKTLATESFVVDKFSVEKNASDARRFHHLTNMPFDEAKELFGEALMPDTSSPFDERVQVIETWIKESVVFENGLKKTGFSRYCWNNKQGILSYEPVPFKHGEHPFVVCRYEIDDELKWYGLFRDLKPLQDYINLSENRMMNMMSSLKIFYEQDAILNVDDFVLNASADNAIVGVRSGALSNNKIHFQTQNQNINIINQKVAEKRNLAKLLSGLNDEALGVANNRQSAVAISQRRDAGLMGLGTYMKISDEMDTEIFKKALNYIMNYFTKKQVFKIVDKRKGERFFSINDNENSKIRIGKFDLVYQTQLKMQGREERFAHWSEMIKTIASIRPDLPTLLLPLMLKDTDSPIAEDIEEILKQADEAARANAEASEQEKQAARAQLELALAQEQARINEIQSKAAKYAAQAELTSQLAKANEQAVQQETNSTTARLKGQDLR